MQNVLFKVILLTAASSSMNSSSAGDLLALLVQQVEQRCGFLADEVEAAAVVDVLNVVPGDALGPVLLLQGQRRKMSGTDIKVKLV